MIQTLTSIGTLVIQLVFVLTAAPLAAGMIRTVKARLQSRKGASIWQPSADLIKLFKKEVVRSATSSWVFQATPTVVFVSTLAVALLLPILFKNVPLHWMGDIIAVIYLFGLGRFFLALAALDTGSAFGGLGSSREMSVASIVEPAMMLSIVSVAVTAGSTDLSSIVQARLANPSMTINPSQLLAFAGLYIVTIAETGRIPVDNPDTHLELTMIHEAMILEYSGRDLAILEWAAQLKLFIFLTLLANMFFPVGLASDCSALGVLTAIVLLLAKVLVLGLSVALVESTNAKLRLFRVPELLMVAFILSLLGLILHFIVGA